MGEIYIDEITDADIEREIEEQLLALTIDDIESEDSQNDDYDENVQDEANSEEVK